MVATVEAVDKEDLRELLGTTEKGKEIYLVRRPNCSVRMIAFGSGGQLPKQLKGGFSSIQAARHVVSSYLAKMAAKEINADGTEVKAKGRVSK
ncbi:MAG: hypothetical protein V3T88_02660 [Nitrosomonadaceae bacterium]